MTDTGWDWQATAATQGDEQTVAWKNWDSITISGTAYNYAQIWNCQRNFEVKLRRASDQVQLTEFDWGYLYDTVNAKWKSTSTPPLPATITSATLESLGAGEFYGIYGITGLP